MILPIHCFPQFFIFSAESVQFGLSCFILLPLAFVLLPLAFVLLPLALMLPLLAFVLGSFSRVPTPLPFLDFSPDRSCNHHQ